MLWKRLTRKIDSPHAQAVHFIVEVDRLADRQSDVICKRHGMVLVLLVSVVILLYHKLAVSVLNGLVLTDHFTALMILI